MTPPNPTAAPAPHEGPELPEEWWGLWCPTFGLNGTFENDNEVLAYATREAASADNVMEPGGLYGETVCIGVHPSYRDRVEAAEKRAENSTKAFDTFMRAIEHLDEEASRSLKTLRRGDERLFTAVAMKGCLDLLHTLLSQALGLSSTDGVPKSAEPPSPEPR